ncbi:MAG: DUF2156 domain-containing protein [Candidatus Pacebacteria bacterium]|nr:DUF2156 domain-containing protein [Candidatus Paceibacterota bacterium]MBP9851579.1 DUF2156 domain-containing protein [Candidatus Paceibacterota bacterium]
MIPEFPKFKKLELSDRSRVEQITNKFPPHSDFNFISMWSWDTKGEVGVSCLYGNLVVKFTDYLTGDPFFSFLGENSVEDTINTLLTFSEDKYKKSHLKYISEDLIKLHVSKDVFDIQDDIASHDYVYEVEHLANMHNWPKHSSGKNIRQFLKEFNDYNVKHFELADAPKKDCLDLFKRWAQNREATNSELNELKAAERLFKSNISELKVVALYLKDKIVGFTVYEIVATGYAVSHFAKADKSHHKSIGDVLNWEEAKILSTQGVKYFNWEEDLGIEGLRKFKEKYKPAFLLKKYKVSRKKS